MKQFGSLFLLVLLSSACNRGGDISEFSYDGPVTDVEWNTAAAAYRGQDGLVMAYQCAKNPDRVSTGNVWGTGTYSDDSSVCSAGVHAGVITYEDGGVVVLEIEPGLASYKASARNGVSSSAWGTWGGSFTVRR